MTDLLKYTRHESDCVLRGNLMEAAEHECDCGLADAIEVEQSRVARLQEALEKANFIFKTISGCEQDTEMGVFSHEDFVSILQSMACRGVEVTDKHVNKTSTKG
jgi:hypothetical protein